MELYNSNLVLILGLATFAIVGYTIYSLYNKYKGSGLDVGQLISVLAVDKSETVFVLVIIGFFITEGITAASVHPEGEQNIPLATILRHIFMAVIGAVSGITAIRDIVSVFMDIPWKYKIWRVLGVVIVLFFSILIPLITVSLIASGLDADLEYQLWLYSLNPFVTKSEYAATLAMYGADPTYRAYSALPMILKGTIWVTVCHMLAMVWEGCRNMGSPTRYAMLMERDEAEIKREQEKAGKKQEKKEEEKKEKDPTTRGKMVDNLMFLLGSIDYPKEKRQTMANLGYAALDRMSRDDQPAMAAKILKLRQSFEAAITNKDQERKKKLKTEIKEFFEASSKAAVEDRGLGLTLAKN